MINTKELTYSIQKNIVSVYYKDMIDDPLTEGKTAEELIDLVEEESLPDIIEIKSIRTTLSKVGSKYRLIALLRYSSNGEPGAGEVVFDDTIEDYDPLNQKVTLVQPEYVVISDENDDVVLGYVTD